MNFSRRAAAENLPSVLLPEWREHLARFGEADGIRRLVCRIADGLPHPDAFRLEIAPEEAVLTASTEAGLFFGTQFLLAQMESGVKTGVTERIPCCDLRGVKVFLPEPTEKGVADFKRMVDLCSRFGYNFLMIETGGAMEYKRHPEINEGWIEYAAGMNEYSGKPCDIHKKFDWNKNSVHATNGGGLVVPQSMIREIVGYCKARSMEVVPELPSLSHCDYLLTRHPELAERAEDPYPDTACPNHPDYYPLLFDLIDEHLAVFAPKRMQLGHDEYYSVALCPRCRGKDPAEIYADDVRKCRDYLRSRGIETMIWGDKVLNAIRPSGETFGGGVNRVWHNLSSPNFTPEMYRSADLIPNDVQMMHWLWAVDRHLEDTYVARGFPMMYGNFRSALFPDWERRKKTPGLLGVCISNWGASDLVTMQRNTLLYEIAASAELMWGMENDYDARRETAFDALYLAHNTSQGPGRYLELVHRTTEARPYRVFYDGTLLESEKDLLGQHIFKSADGAELRFPVRYGTDIPSAKATFRHEPFRETGDPTVSSDCYSVDQSALESSWTARPEMRDGRLAARIRYRLPDDGKRYAYAGFEPAAGFAGEVELLEYREIQAR